MKALADLDVVKIRKEGLWNHYSLNMDKYNEVLKFLYHIFHETENCICKIIDKNKDEDIKI